MRITTVLLMLTALSPSFASEPDWNQGGELHITENITSTQDITLSQQLTLNIAAGQTVSLRGMLTGDLYGLVKAGAGRLELWGDNRALEKITTLREGTLHLAGPHALGQWWPELQAYPGTALSYAAGAEVFATLNAPPSISSLPGSGYDLEPILWRVDDGVAAHTGMILTAIPLIKLGAGTLRLREAASHNNSHLTISEGTVQLDNQFSGHIVVGNAAFLTGGNRIGHLTVGSGGTLVPTGQFDVLHGVAFQPDSRFHVRAWADGQHDSVDVYGTASLGGHVLVLPQGPPESWTGTNDYVIVQADGGLESGQFASVESAMPYLEPSLRYNANQVILHLQPRTAASPPTPASMPTGHASGWAASVRNTLLDDSRFIRDAVYTSGAGQNGFWSHAFHSSGERRGQGIMGGDQRRISGLLLGTTVEITPQWRWGIYGGGSGTQANAHSTRDNITTPTPRASVDSTHLGLHVHSTTAWGTDVTAGAAHSWHRVRSQRHAHTPLFSDALTSTYRARTAQVFAKAQQPLWASADNTTTVEPFVSLAWVRTTQQGHTERGGPLALHLMPDRTSVLFSRVGLAGRHQLSLPQGKATVNASVGWRYASGDTRTPVGQYFRDDVNRLPHRANGLPVLKQAWQLHLGVDAELSKHARLNVQYAGLYGRKMQDHGVQAGLTVRW